MFLWVDGSGDTRSKTQTLTDVGSLVDVPFYCGVGAHVAFGRNVKDEHYDMCVEAGIKIAGTNGEVAAGQWEYQIGICNGIEIGDQMYMARYILQRVCEKHGLYATFDPKIIGGDWNGAGCHWNLSTKLMRAPDTGRVEIKRVVDRLSATHGSHIAVYGEGNHETASIDKFSFGVADRGASVRIPRQTDADGYGYIEDRRVAANCCPYLVAGTIANTIC